MSEALGLLREAQAYARTCDGLVRERATPLRRTLVFGVPAAVFCLGLALITRGSASGLGWILVSLSALVLLALGVALVSPWKPEVLLIRGRVAEVAEARQESERLVRVTVHLRSCDLIDSTGAVAPDQTHQALALAGQGEELELMAESFLERDLRGTDGAEQELLVLRFLGDDGRYQHALVRAL